MIDPRVEIHPTARVANDVTIGPWTVIGPHVEIGEGSWIGPHVVINGPTRIGKNNQIFQFASVGEVPQDKKYSGEDTTLEIGDNNTIREYCTINRGTTQGGSVTRIGNDNWIMAYVHIAHDCIIGNNNIFSSYSALAGHVTIQDYVTLSGFAAVHQFCEVGAHSFVARATCVTRDVLPYLLVAGYDASVCGLNTTGLKRRGFTTEMIENLRRAYKIIFRQGLTVEQALTELENLLSESPEVKLLLDALKNSKRGIVR
ncbi:MAG: acyl-ACP--UDP-N-acetylglucosamine O-acyltransferase [Proteobacteria bacterium]|nr:acyl-ACP--UDP-N-acetylglucosamine O-acyltransferase [Pseudomonadota bacterium]